MTVEPTKEENERQFNIIDQMLSMHSSLRDRLERRAFWLNTILIALSLFLTVFAFVGDSIFIALRLNPGVARFIAGLVAVVMLVCSITEFRVDWRATAGRHADAVSALTRLKAMYRRAFTDEVGGDHKQQRRLTAEYDKVMNALAPLPERWFNRLKAEHQFKRLLSQQISHHPAAPVWFLRLQIRSRGIVQALRRKDPV